MFLIRQLYVNYYMWFLAGDPYTKYGLTTNDNRNIKIHTTYYMPTNQRDYV